MSLATLYLFFQFSTLASVGAAIILLSLPLDLFFQQIISYPSQLVLDSSNATISRAIFYDASPELVFINDTMKVPPDSQLDSFIYPYWQGKGVSCSPVFILTALTFCFKQVVPGTAYQVIRTLQHSVVQ